MAHSIVGNPDVAPLYLKPNSPRVDAFIKRIRAQSPWLNGTMEEYLRERRAMFPQKKIPQPKRVSVEKRLVQIRIGRLQHMTFKF